MSDDREMHTKKNDADVAARAEAALKSAAEQKLAAEKGTPQNPVRAQIELVFLQDGSFHVNGPWHDRIAFEWSMMTATRFVTQQFDRMAIERAKKEGPRVQAVTAVPPGMVDKLRTKGA